MWITKLRKKHKQRLETISVNVFNPLDVFAYHQQYQFGDGLLFSFPASDQFSFAA